MQNSWKTAGKGGDDTSKRVSKSLKEINHFVVDYACNKIGQSNKIDNDLQEEDELSCFRFIVLNQKVGKKSKSFKKMANHFAMNKLGIF